MKRLLVALLATSLIVIRAVMPSVRLDEISLALFIIVCLAILWSDLGKLTTNIRKFRLGDFELELAEKVEKLVEKAEKTEEAEAQRPSTNQPETIPPEVVQRIAEAGTDPRSAILLLGIEIEEAVRQLARASGVQENTPARRLIALLANKGTVSNEVVSLFDSFWQVRNQVVHYAGFDLPPGELYKLVDVGLTILKLLSRGSTGR